ncbi:histidine phosphatase family protein [Actinomadura nitritigenes]|uniref:histidine phosphatase family protein n=1 Tax=Actinomadura nitritigenes TaxID=134602 RepID=UPI003D8C176E
MQAVDHMPRRRGRAGRKAWLEELPDGPTCFVAINHPAVVRAAVLHALGVPPQVFWRIDVAPLTQTWLTRTTGRWRLRETGHPPSLGDW